MDKNKKAEVKKILLATAGGIICISTSILLGKKIKSKKLKSINNIENNRSQAQKNSGIHYLRACRPIFSC